MSGPVSTTTTTHPLGPGGSSTPAPGPTNNGPTTTAAPSSSSSSGTGVDDTKAIAIPLMMIIAILLAIFFTRHSLSSAFQVAKGDFRKMILFGGGLICVAASIFLLPTSAYNFGAASVLFAYMSTLLATPGLLEARADFFFLVYTSWFSILIGIPDGWCDGILKQVDKCDTWFANTTDSMCKDGWITFVTLLAIAVIIMNFFCVIALMSLVFNATDAGHYEQVGGSDGGKFINNTNNVDGEYHEAD